MKILSPLSICVVLLLLLLVGLGGCGGQLADDGELSAADSPPDTNAPTTMSACGATITLPSTENVSVEARGGVAPNLGGGRVTPGNYVLVRDVLFGSPRTVKSRGAMVVDDDAKALTLTLATSEGAKTARVKFQAVEFFKPGNPDRVVPILIVWPTCVQVNSRDPNFNVENQADPPTGARSDVLFEATADSVTIQLPTHEGDELFRFERQ